jgi:hypothetical protein
MSFPHPLQVTAMAAVGTMMSALSDESKLIAVIRAPHDGYFLNNRGRSTTETLSHDDAMGHAAAAAHGRCAGHRCLKWTT